jgi:hypothetical protein
VVRSNALAFSTATTSKFSTALAISPISSRRRLLVPDEQTKQMVESNEMVDMRVRDEDLIDASDPPRRQQRNFSEIEQQTALFEQRLQIHCRIAVATIDQARMEKRSHGKPFLPQQVSRAAWAVLCLHRTSITFPDLGRLY